jgi:predicted Zn finger-like uncharacterized protein
MLIVCPACASQYTIDPERVGARGRTVRCAACRQTWFEGPRPEEESFWSAPDEAAVEDAHEVRDSSEPDPKPEPESEIEPLSVIATTGADPERVERRRRRAASLRVQPVSRAPRSAVVGPRALALAIGVGFAALGGGLVARADVVRMVPQTARLYAALGLPVNLRGLEFRGVTAETEASGEGSFLVVEGEIANLRSGEASVPPIEIAIRGADGQALYTWTNEAPRPTLSRAESVRFRARLASPPAEGRQVFLKFASTAGGGDVAREGLGP